MFFLDSITGFFRRVTRVFSKRQGKKIPGVEKQYYEEAFLNGFDLYRKYQKYNLSISLSGSGKLHKIYQWKAGDIPDADDVIQWMLLLDLQRLTGPADFISLWERVPSRLKRELLFFFLSNQPPWKFYAWRHNIPRNDLSLYTIFNTKLIGIYPYVFHRNDCLFLFDKKIPAPGSGLQGAWEIDRSRAWARWIRRDMLDENDFSIAVSNLNPLKPKFVFQDNTYRVILPAPDLSKVPAPAAFSTAVVQNLELTDGTMTVPTRLMAKIFEVNNREIPVSHKQNIPNPVNYIPVQHNPATAAVIDDTYMEPKDIVIIQPPPAHPVITLSEREHKSVKASFYDEKITDSTVPHISQTRISNVPAYRQPEPDAMHSGSGNAYQEISVIKQEKTYVEQSDSTILPSTQTLVRQTAAITGKVNIDQPFPASYLPPDGQQILIGTGVTQRLLGQGGQGRVYETWSEELEMPLAVKLHTPPPWITDPQKLDTLKAKFLREIKIQANLHHTNIAQIFTYGEWNNFPFVEMEYVKGADISQLLEKYGRINPVVVIALAVQMLSCLNYAHTRTYIIDHQKYEGIIHRDIKPGNAIVSTDGYIKLLDFGIALPSGMFSQTIQAGNIVGTIPYSSPEQLSGKELDPRSDVYSTGVLLYEMLTGKQAFGTGSTVQDIIGNVISGNYANLDNYNIKLPRSVKKIISIAMHKDPDKRFESSGAMLNVCLQELYNLTRELPEAIVRDFVQSQSFRDMTDAQLIPENMLPQKKKKLFFKKKNIY